MIFEITYFVISSQIPARRDTFCYTSTKGGCVAIDDLKILTKVYDMIKYAYPALAQYPKSEKFAIVADIKNCMHQILERVIEANKKYYKKTTLQELDVQIMILRHYIRLFYDLGFLPQKKYEVWAGMIIEIGKMLGGWLKSIKQ